MQLPWNQALELLGIYSKEMKTWIYKNPYMNVDNSFICDSPKLKT